ncbi:MAG: hypothetical protein JWP44_5134 [Mucilaginibacter sp.]|nr:hypothetical protein [Mucilaginibacter sp.]
MKYDQPLFLYFIRIADNAFMLWYSKVRFTFEITLNHVIVITK